MKKYIKIIALISFCSIISCGGDSGGMTCPTGYPLKCESVGMCCPAGYPYICDGLCQTVPCQVGTGNADFCSE